MNEIILTEQNFENEVLKSDIPVLVDFFASWCGPCRMLAPVIAELAEELKGKVKICKVDVDEQPALASQFGVTSIPTVILFKNGKITETSLGYRPKEFFVEMIG